MLLPTPDRYIREIESLVPRINRERTAAAREWIAKSMKQLKQSINSVEDFCAQTDSLNEINKHYQDFRDRVDLYQANYTVLDQHDMTVPKGDKDNFK
jgi:hypothetical protein